MITNYGDLRPGDLLVYMGSDGNDIVDASFVSEVHLVVAFDSKAPDLEQCLGEPASNTDYYKMLVATHVTVTLMRVSSRLQLRIGEFKKYYWKSDQQLPRSHYLVVIR